MWRIVVYPGWHHAAGVVLPQALGRARAFALVSQLRAVGINCAVTADEPDDAWREVPRSERAWDEPQWERCDNV